ncbi:MAG TPA: DMT family transporter [Bacteroidales bacterium]|nr:DMT family transporter [Bacteroidales bacterium]HPT09300.1 DMT family transporter [Bacteroidales bacterium]
MKKFTLPAPVYALVAMLFWGLSFIWSSVLLKYYQPITIIFIRLILSTAFLYTLLTLLKQNEKILRKDRLLIVMSALFNPFLYFLCENYGLKYSTPTIAAVIIAMIPVFSPLVAYITMKEKLRPINFIGIFISFSGVLIMLITRAFSLAVDVRGVLFLGGAVFTSLFYSVTLRKLSVRYSALTIIAYQNLIGIFLFLPLFLVLEFRKAIAVPLNSQIVSSFLLLSVFASSVAFVFFAHSVKHLGISKSNVYTNLIPVFTALFSFLLLSEVFTLQKIAGIGLVIGGVYLSERGNNER